MSFSRLVLLVCGRETWVTTSSFGIGVIRVVLTVSSFYLEMGKCRRRRSGLTSYIKWPTVSSKSWSKD